MVLLCSREFPASKISVDYCGLKVELRPMEIFDAVKVHNSIVESQNDLKKFMPFAHFAQSIESQLRRIRANISSTLEAKEMQFGLFNSDSQALLQVCGLHMRCPLNANGIEIGYWTPTAETKKGYATLATRILIIYCTEALGVDRIQISHNVLNIQSQRVIEKCGFQLEGKIRNGTLMPSAEMIADGHVPVRDLLSYSLLPDEARLQPWYRELCDKLFVFGQLGDELGKCWKKKN